MALSFRHHRKWLLALGGILLTFMLTDRLSAQQSSVPPSINRSLARFGIETPLADPYVPRQPSAGRENESLSGAVNIDGLAWEHQADPNDEKILLASHPGDWEEPWGEDTPYTECPPPQGKPGIFQKLGLGGSWLSGGGSRGLEEIQWEASLTLGFPMPTRERPLLITPQFQMRMWEGSTIPGLPNKVHDASLEFRWLGKLNQVWGYDVSVKPGIYSDFEKYHSDAIRITGHAFTSYQSRPDITLLFGVVYLDREDVNLLPAAGLVWAPHDDIRWELIFPRPRILWRWNCQGWKEDWLYLAGEFGGGSWSVLRSGIPDQVSMSDYRILLGTERKSPSGAGHRMEIGYVFGREVEFANSTIDYKPESTFLLRASWTY